MPFWAARPSSNSREIEGNDREDLYFDDPCRAQVGDPHPGDTAAHREPRWLQTRTQWPPYATPITRACRVRTLDLGEARSMRQHLCGARYPVPMPSCPNDVAPTYIDTAKASIARVYEHFSTVGTTTRSTLPDPLTRFIASQTGIVQFSTAGLDCPRRRTVTRSPSESNRVPAWCMSTTTLWRSRTAERSSRKTIAPTSAQLTSSSRPAFGLIRVDQPLLQPRDQRRVERAGPKVGTGRPTSPMGSEVFRTSAEIEGMLPGLELLKPGLI